MSLKLKLQQAFAGTRMPCYNPGSRLLRRRNCGAAMERAIENGMACEAVGHAVQCREGYSL
jgi:hypothetical protein